MYMHSHEKFLLVELFQSQITPLGILATVYTVGPALALL